MKSFYLLFLVSILSSAVLAQSNIPQVVSFSAVVRDANNQPLANTPVSIRLTFKKGGVAGPLVYCALHQDVSNANGFISLQLNRNVLGTGCNGAPSTTFETIPWKEGGFWMEVEYQTVPNTPFTSLGQLELASSFYAFAAGSAEEIKGVNLQGAQNGYVLAYNQSTGKWEPTPASAGPQGPIGPIGPQGPAGQNGTPGATGPAGPGYSNGTAQGQMMYWNGTSWITITPGSTGQTLTFCNGVPTWGPCPASLATLTTTTVSSITSTTASSGGNITNDGGGSITARGVVWSTTQNPTIALTTKTVDGTGTGIFTSNLTGLNPGTVYYVRAYATNSAGTAYGNQQTLTTQTGVSLNIETGLIPAGTFTMGSPTSEPQRVTDEVQHQVTLSAFRMSKYEITNAQYAAFLNAKNIGSNGLYALGAYPTQALIYENTSWGLTWTGTQWQPVTGKENFPVVNVTWYGATEFATYAGGRLPTEAEWEYACRGNTTTPFSTGACLNNTQANYNWLYPLTGCTNTSTAGPNQTQAVNSYSPNAYGLYNMHGNAWEWCADWYGAYSTTAQTNPTGPATGANRVLRGGSWVNIARGCRSAGRGYFNPVFNDVSFGFRLAFAP